MNTTILEILVKITLIASFVGPIFLIWRFRLMGWLFGIFWFWLFLFLQSWSYCDLEREIYRLDPQGGEPLCEVTAYVMLGGWFFGLVYCSLLGLAMGTVAIVVRGSRKLWESRRSKQGRQ
jgi:hypothetical protein